MRTKTVVLAALCGLIGASAAEAQSVYSVNAVGYVNVSFKNLTYQMFSNPLNAPTNTLAGLFPSPPDGTQIFTWSGASGYSVYTYLQVIGGWDYPDVVINPGQGAFILPGGDFTQTFVGEVPQGNLTNSIGTGYSIISSMVPQGGGVDVLGLTPNDQDQIFVWSPTSGYTVYTYLQVIGGWDTVPQIPVGGSVFILTQAPEVWSRTFNINN
jgi:hypothetical protein